MKKLILCAVLLFCAEHLHASDKIDSDSLKKDHIAILPCCYSLGGGDADALVGNSSADTSTKQSVKPGIDQSIKNAVLEFTDSGSIVSADSFAVFLNQKNLQDRFYTAFIPKEKQIGLFKNKTLHMLELEDDRVGEILQSSLNVRYLFIPITHYAVKSDRNSYNPIPGVEMNTRTKTLYLDFEIYDLEKDTIILNDKVNASAGSWIAFNLPVLSGKGDYQKASTQLSEDLVSSMKDVFAESKGK